MGKKATKGGLARGVSVKGRGKPLLGDFEIAELHKGGNEKMGGLGSFHTRGMEGPEKR